MQLEKIITHEAQLGGQIAKSVAAHHRADFALLLSLLSEDATEFSQFKQIKSDKPFFGDALLAQAKQGAGPKKPLAITPFNALIGQNNTKLLLQSGMTAIALNECLKPEPLSSKDNKNYRPPMVIDNCPPATQRKLLLEKRVELGESEINIDDFYQSIEKSQGAKLNLVA